MATLYWGGGSGTWSSSNTSNWYSDVGRTTLAGSAPTSSDDVVFDSSSNALAYTVTLSSNPVCRNWTVSGPASGNVTFSASNISLNVYGDVSWASTGITLSFNTTNIILAALTGSYSVNFGGLSFGGGMVVYFGPATSSTATWTLGAAIAGSSYINFRSGTFNSNNYNITASIIGSSGDYGQVITLGTSTLTGLNAASYAFDFRSLTTPGNFSATSSTMILTSGAGGTYGYFGSGLSYGTLRFGGGTDSSGFGQSTTFIITGSCNVNTLNLDYTSSLIPYIFTMSGGTFNIGTLSISDAGTISNRRRIFKAYSTTEPLYLNVDSLVNCTHIDLRGVIAGGAATWSGHWGDHGDNQNVTFAPEKTVYYVGSASTYGMMSTTNNWSLTSGGSTNTSNNYPLPQDSIIIDNNSFPSGTGSVFTYGSVRHFIKNIDFSNRTTPLTFNLQYGFCVLGNFTGSPAVTFTNSLLECIGSTSNTDFNLNGATFTNPSLLSYKQSGKALNMTSAATLGGTLIASGTWNTNDYTITCSSLSFGSSSFTPTLNTGHSKIYNYGNLTYNRTDYDLSTMINTDVYMLGNGVTLQTNTLTHYARYHYARSTAGTLNIIPSNSVFSYVECTSPGGTLTIDYNDTITFGNLKINSNIGNKFNLKSSTTAPATVKATQKIDLDYVNISYLNANTTNTFYAGKNGTSVAGTNTNWVFGQYSKPPQKASSLAFFN